MFEPIPPHPALIERVARLEERQNSERETRQREISWLQSSVVGNVRMLSGRLSILERQMPDQGAADRKALLKLGLAVTLPVAVYLLTGSISMATKVMGAISGIP